MDDAIDALVRSRRLATDADVEQFDRALDALPAELSGPVVIRLLDGFDDDSAVPEVTFNLIHRIEKTASPRYEQALVAGLPHLHETAPWWAEVLVIRIVNSDSSRAAVISAAGEATPEERATLRSVLDGIADRDAVGVRAVQLIETLWPI